MVTRSTTFRASKLSPTELADAQQLRQRFEEYKRKGGTQKQFAVEFDMPGGASSITQHLQGLRPISIEQAKAYMRGFGCSLDEISQALATKVQFSAQPAAADLVAKADQLLATLGTIPEDRRELAYSVALQALVAFLPGSSNFPKPGLKTPVPPKKPTE